MSARYLLIEFLVLSTVTNNVLSKAVLQTENHQAKGVTQPTQDEGDPRGAYNSWLQQLLWLLLINQKEESEDYPKDEKDYDELFMY